MKKKLPNITSYILATYSAFTLILFTCSCSETSEKNNQQEVKSPQKKHQIIKKPGSSFSDTIVVTANSAVFYNPDSLQMEKIKVVNEKDIFDMLTHDCHYQQQNARMVIKKYWPQIKIIKASKARYLLFVKINKTKIYIDLNDKNDICGLFLFNGKKDPVLVDMPNVDTELGFYFSK
ncbi:MAG: hypothetical protein ABI358_10145 [Ginsengibacter sp.]